MAYTVYIASPYTKGDVALNVRKQIETADYLTSIGFLPFWPLSSHFWHMVFPHPYEYWTKIDFQWVLECDCVLRLPGDSSGADAEVEFASRHRIPVFFSIQEMCDYFALLNTPKFVSTPRKD